MKHLSTLRFAFEEGVRLKTLVLERKEDFGRAVIGLGSSLVSDESGDNREVAMRETRQDRGFFQFGRR